MLRKWICAVLALCLTLGILTTGALASQVTEPAQAPTAAPTEPPTEAPTAAPTEAPTVPPTEAPTVPPTQAPTEAPKPLSGTCGASLSWTMDPATFTLTISGTGAMDDFAIRPWESWVKSIRKIVVQPGVTGICTQAFSECTALTEVSLPGSLYILGNSVFAGCTSLKSVTIPAGLTFIPYGTFSGCTSLASIGIPGTILGIERHAFAYCSSLTKIRFSGHAPNFEEEVFYDVKATAIYPGLDTTWTQRRLNYGGDITWEPDTPKDTTGLFGDNFSWVLEGGKLTITGKGHMRGWDTEEQVPWHHLRDKVTEVVMQGNMWSIYPWAFKNMPGLTKVTWPQDLNIIYSSVFYNCTGLTELDIPDSVTDIKEYAFYGCASLGKISLPSRLKTLSAGALGGCKSLDTVEIPDSLKEIGKNVFYYSGLKSITIPKNITKLPQGLFQGCRSLSEVEFEGKVTSIGKECFESCSKLKKLTLPAGVKTLSEGAFAESGLTELIFEGDMPNFSTGVLYGLTAKLYYPRDNTSWSDTRIQALENGYSGNIRCYAGTPGNAERPNDPTEAPTVPATEAPTQAPTEEPTRPAATEPPVTGPALTEPEETAPAATEPEETQRETSPKPVEKPQTPEKPRGPVLWPFIAGAVVFLVCVIVLVADALERKARRRRRKNRKRKSMEW